MQSWVEYGLTSQSIYAFVVELVPISGKNLLSLPLIYFRDSYEDQE